MATIRYKGKTTVTTPVRSRGTSGSDASSARIASERASSGAVSMTGERNESAAQRKARLGIMDTPDGGTTEIDTAQPSPTTVDATKGLPGTPTPTTPQGMVPYDQALKGLQQSGQSAKDIAGATTSLQNAYKTGQAQLAGTPVPSDPGQAMTQVQGAMPPPTPDMSATDLALQEDKGWQGLLQMKEEYFNPENQKASLMDTYNKLFKKSGLDQLDEEIIDAQTVIEGTEDDIRNEIEQAGGFGTDSQVQALSLSRNKVLLKNYNNLVALRESKANTLDRMMNFAEKDRAYADSQFDRMLNYDMQMLNYRDKFIQNARDQYNKYDPAQLNAMLAGNPRQLAFAEDIMGLGRGGLAKLASVKTTAQKLDEAQLYGQQLQNQKLKQEISGTEGGGTLGTVDPKKAQAINTILGSGKFTKDQASAIRNAITNGEDPFTVIKNQAKALMTGANQTKIESYETSQDALNNIEQTLKEFYANGGNTNIFRGTYEKTVNKLGEVKDPKLVELATQIQQNLQIYRNAVSGTAYSVQEGADIASIFPGITKTEGLNKAIISGRKQAFKDGIDGAYRATLGSTYDQFKQAENTIPAQDFSKGTVNGLNFNIPGVGSFTFPDLKSLEAFKKDHNI